MDMLEPMNFASYREVILSLEVKVIEIEHF